MPLKELERLTNLLTSLEAERDSLIEQLRQANLVLDERVTERTFFLNAIIENLPNMIFIKAASDLRFVLFNTAGEILLGIKREDLIGKTDHDLFPKKQADYFTQKDRKTLESQKMVSMREFIDTPTGRRRVWTKKVPILDESGNAIYLLGISQDLTNEIEKHETEFQDQQEFFWKYAYVIFVVASETHFLRLNPRWTEVTGFSEEEMLTEPFFHWIHPDDIPKTQVRLQAGVPTVTFSNRFKKKSGGYVRIQWRSRGKIRNGFYCGIGEPIDEEK